MMTLSTMLLLLSLPTDPGPGLTGAISGAPFQPDVVTIKRLSTFNEAKVNGKVVDRALVYVLTFQVGTEFMPENDLSLHIAVETDSAPYRLAVDERAFRFGTPEFRQQRYPPRKDACVGRGLLAVFGSCAKPSRGLPAQPVWNEELDCRLQIVRVQGGKAFGTIDLRMPAKDRTWLRGCFAAKIEQQR